MENYKAEKVTAASLCFDILTNIFHFLNTKDKGSAAQVCTSWRKAANSKSLWKFTEVTLRSGNLDVCTEQNIIERGIKQFRVFEPKVNEFLRQIPNVEHLRFIGCCIKQNAKEILDSLPDGAEFFRYVAKDYHTNLPDNILESIDVALRAYHKLNDTRCIINNDNVLKTFITGMKHLKVLHLDGCWGTSSASMDSNINIDLFDGEKYIYVQSTANEDRLPSLQKLCLRNYFPVRQKTMGYICQTFVNLISLNFESCILFPDEGYAHLPKLKRLEFVTFRMTHGITDSWLDSISHLSNLKFLKLGDGMHITSSGFEPISRLKNLTHLKLYNLHIDDAAYRHLNGILHLRKLKIRVCSISDTSLSYLAEGNLKLTKLDLTYCSNVTDQGLLNICQSTFVLQKLKLVGLYVTDYGISHIIKRFSDLHMLNVTDCAGVSEKQVMFGNRDRNKKLNLSNISKDRDPMTLSSNSRLDSFLSRCFTL